MKQSVKRAQDSLQALGFQSDSHPYKPATRIYWHANEPGTKLSIFAGMSDAAASKVVRHAEAIVGLAHTETDSIEKRAKREAEAKRRDREAKAKEIASAKQRAAEKERERRASLQRQYVARQAKGRLTRSDRLLVLDHIADEFIDVPRIADELCIPERKIREAIAGETLPAYMCSGQIKCKRHEVRSWIAGGAA